jgi:hypothetical protein
MDTIKFPITFDKGRMSVISEQTRPYYSQVIAFACRIEKNELPLEITYGVKDATFNRFRKAELNYTINKFWPEVRITTLEQTEPDSNGVTRLIIDFTFEGQ